MLYVCVGNVMNGVFSVCNVRRGAVGAGVSSRRCVGCEYTERVEVCEYDSKAGVGDE